MSILLIFIGTFDQCIEKGYYFIILSTVDNKQDFEQKYGSF